MQMTKRLLLTIVVSLAAVLPAAAQSAGEISAAKAIARSYGYSENEINAVMNGDTKGAANGNPETEPIDEKLKTEKNNPDTLSMATPMSGRQAPESEIYGHNFFISDGLSILPSYNAPVPASYVIGAGDKVTVDVWGSASTSFSATVSKDGAITVPHVGPVTIGGKTLAQAETHLKSRMASVYSGLSSGSASLRLTIDRLRGVNVYVVGDVTTPGVYSVPSLSSVTTAIYMAGGVRATGSVRNIQIFRDGTLAGTFDLYDFMCRGKYESNLRLHDGDVISVAIHGPIVTTEGSLVRKRKFEMKEKETIADLLVYAGGFTRSALRERVHIDRNNATVGSSFDVPESNFDSFCLVDGDVISALKFRTQYNNRVVVKGGVQYDGPYAISDSISNVSELIRTAGGIREGVYMDRAIIKRTDENFQPQIIAFNVADVVAGRSNVDLFREDTICFYTIKELNSDMTVDIFGEVNTPGTFQYSEGMTIADLVILAEGYAVGADKSKVEVACRGKNTMGEVKTFNLESDPSKANYVLQPFDIVFIRKYPYYREQQTITVNGEVCYPGTYVVDKNQVRLSDVITRAGGVTNEAFVEGARLIRQMTEAEKERLETVQTYSKHIESDKDTTIFTIKDSLSTYVVAISLQDALKHPGSDADVILTTGDVIEVPMLNNTVKVSGGVYFPNTVTYKSGYGLKNYINEAGGFVKGARRGSVFAVYMNGSSASRGSSKFRIEPGMEIVVPQKDESGGRSMTAQEIASVASVSTTMAYMVVAIVNTMMNMKK